MFKKWTRKNNEHTTGMALAVPEPALLPLSPGVREALRSYTPARVGLESTGVSLATMPLLDFQLAHARARDAVHAAMDVRMLCDEVRRGGWTALALASQARDRATFLRRPDLGRALGKDSEAQLTTGQYDVVFVIADGLSALAAERHSLQLLRAMAPLLKEKKVAPVCVVEQGRVAIGDAIGAALGAQIAVVMLGERPGLSSPDSLGVYITWDPKPGRLDSERNCISNVREEGLSYEAAAVRLQFYLEEASRRQMTGIALKDPSEVQTTSIGDTTKPSS
jgi:ethanolamine ammonia-lyase small subunit